MKGILLANIGTPDSPKPADVRRYLTQFLLDPRILDIGWAARNFLVRSIIVPFRHRQSAKNYQAIWTKEGSPLSVYTEKLASLLQHELGSQYLVSYGFRYGNPSFESSLEIFKQQGIKKITIIPLFPQYASATTGSILETLFSKIGSWKQIPDIRTISSFWNHPLFIETWAQLAAPFVLSDYDHIIFSYHGLPVRQIRSPTCKLDSCCTDTTKNNLCYRAQCFGTTKKLVERLGINENCYNTTFQSRLGKEKWLEPYTTDILKARAKLGDKRILLFSPSFVADCLETLHELDIEAKEEFLELGGTNLDCVPCPNAHPSWVQTLSALVRQS